MEFRSFFSEQAKKPSGFFGRFIMPVIFDRGNALLNAFMEEMLVVEEDDRILEIGFGTGKFISGVAKRLRRGLIEGVDFSNTMVTVAKRKNRKHIDAGKVILRQGDFAEMPYRDNSYHKICSCNTIYFWPDPDQYANKIYKILKPGGKLVLAFEDTDQLESRPLSNNVFKFFHLDEIEDLLNRCGFHGGIEIISREKKSLKYHCAVAEKDS